MAQSKKELEVLAKKLGIKKYAEMDYRSLRSAVASQKKINELKVEKEAKATAKKDKEALEAKAKKDKADAEAKAKKDKADAEAKAKKDTEKLAAKLFKSMCDHKESKYKKLPKEDQKRCFIQLQNEASLLNMEGFENLSFVELDIALRDLRTAIHLNALGFEIDHEGVMVILAEHFVVKSDKDGYGLYAGNGKSVYFKQRIHAMDHFEVIEDLLNLNFSGAIGSGHVKKKSIVRRFINQCKREHLQPNE